MSCIDLSHEWFRITVLLEETLEQWLIDQAMERGVASYICTYCSGKPPQTPFEDPCSGRGLVRMELLVPKEKALEENPSTHSSPGSLLSFLKQLPRAHFPLTVIVETVSVFTDQPVLTASRAS